VLGERAIACFSLEQQVQKKVQQMEPREQQRRDPQNFQDEIVSRGKDLNPRCPQIQQPQAQHRQSEQHLRQRRHLDPQGYQRLPVEENCAIQDHDPIAQSEDKQSVQ